MPGDLIERFLRPIRGGPRTRHYPDVAPVLAAAMRGFPDVDPDRCDAAGECIAACPTTAITLAPPVITIDAGRCVFCGACEAACPEDAITLGRRFELSARTRDGLRISTTIRSEP
ncbi:MAG: 4Fe-4S dicluster domain-containing protein [Candidatus Limnocylindrales bacterium]